MDSITDWITAGASVLAAVGTLWAVWVSVLTARRAEKARRDADERATTAENAARRSALVREKAQMHVEMIVNRNHLGGMPKFGGNPGLAAEYAARASAAKRRIAEIDEMLGWADAEEPPSPPREEG